MRKERHFIPISELLLAVFVGVFFAQTCLGQVHVLVDQVGYETLAPKQAIVEGSDADHPQRFALIDADSGKTVYEASLQPSGKVFAWKGRVFWTADFSS